MTLRDEIVKTLAQQYDHYGFNRQDAADAIIALVLAHATSDEAVERAKRSLSFHPSVRAAITAALTGETP